jgi:hypothetical protein
VPLPGRPTPCGYRLVDAGPHSNPGKAATGQRLRRLEPDPVTTPVVERIFAEWLAGGGLRRIAEGLTGDGILSPSAYDAARNRHRAMSRGAWGKSAIRAILANPRYTGYEVWNKQRRDRSTPRPYVLRGLLRCGLCERKMQGSWNHGSAHYRCTFASEYALAKRIDHPKALYIREDTVMPKLEGWLAQVFDPVNLDATCQAMAAAQRDDDATPRAEAARQKIADCDRRLANYRKTIDAGGPTAIIVGWMAEVEAERLAAERELGKTVAKEPLTPSHIKAIVVSLTDHLRLLAEADPATKAILYANLGIALTYHPDRQVVTVEADLSRVHKSVSEGGLEPPCPCGH